MTEDHYEKAAKLMRIGYGEGQTLPPKYQYEVEEYNSTEKLRDGVKRYGKEGWRVLSTTKIESGPIVVIFERIE